ncbi:hypothetical protein [Mycolicibacter hiberniae]|uniref:PE-PGRS family protein n=1 Tax=Mycolicibacter hiberniae TaxID=29314 RepID=A0A7I7X3X7_9MYCO|nr:hypothetical protein [Mycolicibacter hiberniae]MCV7084451.1 hypothetical protein [Mycolicibacter hiberniae]BBZ22988.1 hypothetical protein MHIB_14060 [Mycolicibacter hiberniae]
MTEPMTRSCVAGIALLSAGIVTAAPVPAPAPAVAPSVALAASYGDLFANTVDNIERIGAQTDWSALAQVFTTLFTNPLGLIDAASSFTLAVDTDTASLPATLAVQLSPGLELLIAGLTSHVATLDALFGVIEDLGDPKTAWTALVNAPATLLDAYLNGQRDVSLLGGAMSVPMYNGVLAPEQNLELNLDLSRVLDMLGLQMPDLGSMDLDTVIEHVRLGTLTVGTLLSGLGLSDEGMGDLLAWATGVGTLGDLLESLGLGDLGLSQYSLAALLSEWGGTDFYRDLDLDLALGDFRFADVVSAFGVDAAIPLAVGHLLVGLGEGDLSSAYLGSLLSDIGLLGQLSGWLQEGAADLFDPIPLIGPLLTGLADEFLGSGGLEALLNTLQVGDLLGDLAIDDSIGSVLGSVGEALLSLGELTIGGVLTDLGFADSVADLTLRDLVSDLVGPLGAVLTDGPLGLDLTWLLNGLDLGDVLAYVGVDTFSLNLGDLVGDWVNPYLADLLEGFVAGQLTLAGASVGSFGGTFTELLVSMPQQILDMLDG